MRYRRDGASDEPISVRRAKITPLGMPIELEESSREYQKKFEAKLERRAEAERIELEKYDAGKFGLHSNVLPWFKFCVVCGVQFWRKGEPNVWATTKNAKLAKKLKFPNGATAHIARQSLKGRGTR